MNSINTTLNNILDSAGISTLSNNTSHINVGTTDRIISAAAGGLLIWYGVKKRSMAGAALALTGASLVYRGITAHSRVNEYLGVDTASENNLSIDLTSSLTINKPKEELYAYWRRLENLPSFMKHLKEVKQKDSKHSDWEARVPGNITSVKWEARIIEEKENEKIVWSSTPGSEIDNAGVVSFEDAPGGRGTVVRTTISYQAPEGKLGASAAKLMNPFFKQMVKEDLRRFKRLMETGEIITTEGQPSGR